MYCCMKMSLCNTFRLFFITTIVLSIIETRAAFTVRRTTSGTDTGDLAQEESVILEVKHDLKRINDVPVDLLKVTSPIKLSDVPDATKKQGQSTTKITTSDVVVTTELSIKELADIKTKISEPVTESTTVYNKFTENDTKYHDTKIDVTTLTTSEAPSSLSVSTNVFLDSDTTVDDPKTVKIYEVTQPLWKKYTTIERIRATPTTPIALLFHEAESSYGTENIEKAETKKQSRISLQDASEIGSLEKLKIELLLTTMKQQAAEKQSTTLLTENTITEEPITSTFPISTLTSTESSTRSAPKYSVESKRAGYLDFSSKTRTDEKPIVTSEIALKTNDRELLRAMFETESEIEAPEEKTDYRVESQSQLSEDALKEELLKENILSDNEENAKRVRDESLTSKGIASETTTINEQTKLITKDSSLNEQLKVKPISMNTEKNTVLYPVNPHYKPLKKIDVQPPKLFLRDPDDNTWRNESLSSLGIVFKPSNSSKPFTQVLKNKTELEWNNSLEKENRNETPDLRERLKKIAEMRKLKKNKIDSSGNIIYFDYEENNSSGESVNLSKENINREINATTPFVSSSSSSSVKTSSVSSVQPVGIITTTSTMDAEFAKEFRVSSTEKPVKFFNVPEYYDNTDDEDTDYLNMAKIDIKKFTTSKVLSNTPTTEAWPGLKFGDKRNHVTHPDRKATVQFFPPLKTLKSNINDYDNNFKNTLNSYTTESDEPKHVLPVSTDTTSTLTPEYRTTIQYNKYYDRKNFDVTTKPNFFKNMYLTRQPTTTDDFMSPGDGGEGYVMKHYRDFINKAAKDAEYDKNVDYTPFTDVPLRGVTKSEFNKYDKDKSKINMGDDYDEEAQFRKDVLQRFVNNFNHNSHRFRSDFPVLFNNSVIHGEVHNGRDIASSRAFMRGLYENRLKSKSRACDPHCDNFNVELSPAYELHYYVPDQEERQEALPPPTAPYRDM